MFSIIVETLFVVVVFFLAFFGKLKLKIKLFMLIFLFVSFFFLGNEKLKIKILMLVFLFLVLSFFCQKLKIKNYSTWDVLKQLGRGECFKGVFDVSFFLIN